MIEGRPYEPLNSLTIRLLAEVHMHSLLALLLILARYRHDSTDVDTSNQQRQEPVADFMSQWTSSILGSVAIVGLVFSLLYQCPGLIKFIVTSCAAEWPAILWMAGVGAIGGLIGAKWLLVTEKDGYSKLRVILGRKFFHVIALIVSLPILTASFEMCLTGWALFVFVVLLEETARIYDLFGQRQRLTAIVAEFSDDRDLESVVITPLYLALGCEMPMVYAYLMYVAPLGMPVRYFYPKTLTWPIKIGYAPPQRFLLVSFVGILATTIGDSAAALVPNWLLKNAHVISGRCKTWEGLLSFAVCHFITVIVVVCRFATIPYEQLAMVSLYAATMECFTHHVDNYWVSVQSVLALEFLKYVFG